MRLVAEAGDNDSAVQITSNDDVVNSGRNIQDVMDEPDQITEVDRARHEVLESIVVLLGKLRLELGNRDGFHGNSNNCKFCVCFSQCLTVVRAFFPYKYLFQSATL